jgi:hypothetical protein
MRFLLALLAILALMVSPVTAAAAQAACSHAGPAAMAGMDMSAMPGMAQVDTHKGVGDPCCDHTGKHKMSDKSCAQACATSCAVTAALPSSPVSVAIVFARAPMALARPISVHSHSPAGLERPPKSIA